MSKRNQKCAECHISLDAEHEPAVLVDGRSVCSRCAEDLNMPCDCGSRKCEECNAANEGEGDWGPER